MKAATSVSTNALELAQAAANTLACKLAVADSGSSSDSDGSGKG